MADKRGLINLIKAIVQGEVAKVTHDIAPESHAGDSHDLPQMAPQADSRTIADITEKVSAKLAGDRAKGWRNGAPSTGFGSGGGRQATKNTMVQNWAQKILKMGPGVPDGIKQTALEVAHGVRGPNDKAALESFRTYTGTARSGAKAVKGGLSSYRKVIGQGAQIGTLLNTAKQGGASASFANAELVGMGVDHISKAFDSKSVQKALGKAMSGLFSDPAASTRLLRAMGRGIRLGGAAVSAALIAWDLGEGVFDRRKRNAQADGNSIAATNTMVGDPTLARSLRGRAGKQVHQMRSSGVDDVMNFFGFGDTEAEEKEKMASRMAGTVAAAGKGADALGINRLQVFQQYAKDHGTSVNNITDAEKTEALNNAASQKLDDIVGAKEGQVQSMAEQRGIFFKPESVQRLNMSGGYQLTIASYDLNNSKREGQIEAIRQEIRDREAKAAAEQATKVAASQQLIRRAEPLEVKQRRTINIDRENMDFTARQHRFQQVEYD